MSSMAISSQHLSEISEAQGACDREIILIERELMNLQAQANQVTAARLLPVLHAFQRATNQLSRAIYYLREGHREERGGAAASGRH